MYLTMEQSLLRKLTDLQNMFLNLTELIVAVIINVNGCVQTCLQVTGQHI